MSPSEQEADEDKLLETSGGEAPTEWDEDGNPIRYKTEIALYKKEPQ